VVYGYVRDAEYTELQGVSAEGWGEFALKKTYDAARKTAKYDSAALRDTSRIMYAKKAIPKDPLGFG